MSCKQKQEIEVYRNHGFALRSDHKEEVSVT